MVQIAASTWPVSAREDQLDAPGVRATDQTLEADADHPGEIIEPHDAAQPRACTVVEVRELVIPAVDAHA